MRFWLIGCGVVLVAIVGIGIFFGNIIFRQVKEASGKVDEAAVAYQQLKSDYPFEVAWGANLTPTDVERFVACRKEVLSRMKSLILVLEDEELSDFEKMTRSLNIIPTLATSHAEALGRVQMSPDEYLWILNQVLLVLKYAEADQAPEELKTLAQQMERPPDGLFGPAVLYSTSYFPESPNQLQSDLLPQIEPWQINMSGENVEAVLKNRPGLEATMLIFFCFDHYFKTTYRQLLHAPQNVDGAAGDTYPTDGRSRAAPDDSEDR